MSYISSGWNKRDFNLNYGMPAVAENCIPDPYWTTNPLTYPRTVLNLRADDSTPRDNQYSSTILTVTFEGANPYADLSPAGRTATLTGDGDIVDDTTFYNGEKAFENVSGKIAYSGTVTTVNATPFCMEFAIQCPTVLGPDRVIFSIGTPGVLNHAHVYIDAIGRIVVFSVAGGFRITGYTIAANTTIEIRIQFTPFGAASYDGSMQINGTNVGGIGSGVVWGSIPGLQMFIGSLPSGNLPFIGKIFQARIGTAIRPTAGAFYLRQFFKFPGSGAATAVDSSGIPKTVTYLDNVSPGETGATFPDATIGTQAFEFCRRSPSADVVCGLQVTDHADFNFEARDFYIKMLTRLLDYGAIFAQILYFSVGANIFQLLRSSGSQWRLIAASSGGTVDSGLISTFAPNITREILLQRRGANFELFNNGTKIATLAVPGGAAATVNVSSDIAIGYVPGSPANNWVGLMDEIHAVNGTAYSLDGSNYIPDGESFCGHN